jgi:hypothetical protein
MSFTTHTMTKNAFSMLDMMMNMQRLSLQAVSAYQPLVSAFLDSTKTAEHAARPFFAAAAARPRAPEYRESHDSNEEQVIGVGEEVLNVGTRMVAGKTTRVRRRRCPGPLSSRMSPCIPRRLSWSVASRFPATEMGC